LIEQHIRAGYDRERFQLLRLGVPLDIPSPVEVSLPLRDVFNGVGWDRTLLFAGGLNLIKGAQVLIEALGELVRAVPRFRLIVAGRKVPEFVTQLLNFDRSVQLLGQVPFQEMRLLYAAVDLTAVPSTCRENFPLVAAESVAMGTPVVGSAHGGTGEIVREGATGYLVPPGDPQALAQRVIEHFTRPASCRRQMRLRCARRGRELVSWEKHLDQLAEVYVRLV
jgi:glycosyltransferase involved in cell wall biosynthesis